MKLKLCLALTLALLGAGCDDDDDDAVGGTPTGGTQTDATLPDAALDGTAPDAAIPDAAIPDAAVAMEVRIPAGGAFAEIGLTSGEVLSYSALFSTYDQALADWFNGVVEGNGGYWANVAINPILEATTCLGLEDAEERQTIETTLIEALEAKYLERNEGVETSGIELLNLLVDACAVPAQ